MSVIQSSRMSAVQVLLRFKVNCIVSVLNIALHVCYRCLET